MDGYLAGRTRKPLPASACVSPRHPASLWRGTECRLPVSEESTQGRNREGVKLHRWSCGAVEDLDKPGTLGLGVFLVSQLSLASRRFLAWGCCTCYYLHPIRLTSGGLRVGAPLGAGSPTAEAGSWSSCAGQFCRGWHVGGSSAGAPHSLSPEAEKPCSLVGSGSYTASRWAVQADPLPLGHSVPQGKGCQALRLVLVRLGCRWLSPEAHS